MQWVGGADWPPNTRRRRPRECVVCATRNGDPRRAPTLRPWRSPAGIATCLCGLFHAAAHDGLSLPVRHGPRRATILPPWLSPTGSAKRPCAFVPADGDDRLAREIGTRVRRCRPSSPGRSWRMGRSGAPELSGRAAERREDKQPQSGKDGARRLRKLCSTRRGAVKL